VIPETGYFRPSDPANIKFELASPSAAIEHGLWLSTADQEVTVGLHTHHSHFTDYDNRFDLQHITDALDYVALDAESSGH
jgi:hypothetical protein